MKKRSFGLKLSTIFTAVICLIVAVLFWLFVKYDEFENLEALKMSLSRLPFIL